MSDKMKYLYLKIPETLFDALQRWSFIRGGQDIQKVLEDFLIRGMSAAAEELEVIPPQLELFMKVHESDVREMEMVQLLKLASRWIASGSELDMEALELMCTRLGRDVSDVLESLKANSELAAVMQDNISDKLKLMATKLIEKMGVGVVHPANDMQKFLADRGASTDSIKRIKKLCGVKSFRGGDRWMWVIPESEAP